jgi:hypothetical protein
MPYMRLKTARDGLALVRALEALPVGGLLIGDAELFKAFRLLRTPRISRGVFARLEPAAGGEIAGGWGGDCP